MYAATQAEYPDRGHTKEAQKKKRIKTDDKNAPQREEGQISKPGKSKETGQMGINCWLS